MLYFGVLVLLVISSWAYKMENGGVLPGKVHSTAALYDGDDTIYIVGGINYDGIQSGVVKYSISTQVSEVVGKFPVPLAHEGTAHIDPETGNMFYFGGRRVGEGTQYSSIIWKFNASHPDPVEFGHLPVTLTGHCSIHDDEADGVWIYGGANGTAFYSPYNFFYNIQTNVVTTITPENVIGKYQMPCVRAPATGKTYAIGGYNPGPTHQITVVNSSSVESTSAILRTALWQSSAVTDGELVYNFGGWNWDYQFDIYLEVFNPIEESLTSYWPEGLVTSGTGVSSVYIQKLNRVYLFGGLYGTINNPIGQVDWIQYMDLTL